MKRVSILTKATIIALVLSLVTGVAVYAAAGIDIEKYVSVDGENWLDADDSGTGPTVTEGATVLFKYEITNTGEVDVDPALTYTVTDDVLGSITDGTEDPLGPGTTATITKYATAGSGEQGNVATVNASEDGGTTYPYTDSDAAYYTGVAPVSVEIDIKPGSDPNSINLKSKGVVPVALLGSESFDVSTVDDSTVTFGPGEATIAHNSAHLEDVNGDGYLDMVLHFRTQELNLDETSEVADLTISSEDAVGSSYASHVGQDEVNIVPKGKGSKGGKNKD